VNKKVDGGKARVVMRKDGNLEVILNSALFKGMACSKGGEKRVTFTGAKEVRVAASLILQGYGSDICSRNNGLQECAQWPSDWFQPVAEV